MTGIGVCVGGRTIQSCSVSWPLEDLAEAVCLAVGWGGGCCAVVVVVVD